MFPAFARACRLWFVSAATLAFISPVLGQSASTLPTITIEAEQQAPASGGSLTVPTAQQAQSEIQRTPGGVAIVRAEDYKTTTPAVMIKDVLDYVPGVFVQPKWGEDSRLSIRGSGLSRNFHLRGVQLFMDGIPINTADGYGDFQEIDPTAYRYVEVYKGANALRYGALRSAARSISSRLPGATRRWRRSASTLAVTDSAAPRRRRRVRRGRGMVSSPPRASAPTVFATTATAIPSAAAAISATRSRRTSRRASISTATMCGSAFRGR
jgi:hypothetical protein